MMSYLDSLLKKRGLKECLLPLWKLKITEEEFKELRELLEKQTHVMSMCNNPFITLSKECTLFFAEYWRRLYVDGKHSKQMVYDALESTRHNVNLCDEFYEAARRGARLLKIEKYDGGRADPLNDMLYQGGLPMKLVTANVSNSVWDRFTRGLVNRKYNFEELNLGLVASQSRCLRDYCEQLILGIEAEQFMLMPFYCLNENDTWYMYLKELAKQEKIRRSQLHPYSLFWEFRIDNVEKKIYTKYIVKGAQRLPKEFLEEHGLTNVTFFSVQVRRNSQAIDTFDYANNFCRYAVVSKHPYTNGDYISLFLHNQEEPYIADNLDMTVPHLLCRNKDGKYELGNQIGKQESMLLIPEGWIVDDSCTLDVQEYSWGETTLHGILIPSDYTNNILVKGDDGAITFGMNAPLYWTEMQSNPLYVPDVIEPVYNADKCNFSLCFDTEDGTESKRRPVQYRNKWQKEWMDSPSYGELYARAIDVNGNYVTPLRFVNIGDGLVISLQKADKDSCQIRVTWPHGHVSTTEGEKKIGDVWEIKKENCRDPRLIRFCFTPDGNSQNQFFLSIKAPFKDFSIINIYGDEILDNCWIPYSDVDKYQYHIVGQDIKEYKYGNIKRELRWKSDKLYIIEDGRSLKHIPYEGSLLTLFDSRETLRALLERTSQNMINAEVRVQFTLSDGKKISFSIKDSPFRPRQLENGQIIITGNNKRPIKFNGVLKLIKLSEPELDPVEMSYDEDLQMYILPETIREWGKTILIGRTRGRICPSLVDLTRDMDGDYRAKNRETAISSIQKDLQESVLGNDFWKRTLGWFYRSQKDDIPASSILELLCTAQSYKSLLCMAFQLYVKCSNTEERDLLKAQLKSFSDDLAFQWYWIQPYLDGMFAQLYSFIDNLTSIPMQEIYIKWAMTKEERMNELLSALGNSEMYMQNIGQCINEFLTSFTSWIKELCIESLIDCY
ncbi:hypothetical protein [Prevotella sp.]|uniref:hypothetical protein n=1 Tax=Prevotella sp. TaxID=59823 RepID=UPI0027E3051B|nr:hypothetical protein [Prevotella sp.]